MAQRSHQNTSRNICFATYRAEEFSHSFFGVPVVRGLNEIIMKMVTIPRVGLTQVLSNQSEVASNPNPEITRSTDSPTEKRSMKKRAITIKHNIYPTVPQRNEYAITSFVVSFFSNGGFLSGTLSIILRATSRIGSFICLHLGSPASRKTTLRLLPQFKWNSTQKRVVYQFEI